MTFNFSRFDPVTPNLYLMINASQEFNVTIREPPGQVTGVVDPVIGNWELSNDRIGGLRNKRINFLRVNSLMSVSFLLYIELLISSQEKLESPKTISSILKNKRENVHMIYQLKKAQNLLYQKKKPSYLSVRFIRII